MPYPRLFPWLGKRGALPARPGTRRISNYAASPVLVSSRPAQLSAGAHVITATPLPPCAYAPSSRDAAPRAFSSLHSHRSDDTLHARRSAARLRPGDSATVRVHDAGDHAAVRCARDVRLPVPAQRQLARGTRSESPSAAQVRLSAGEAPSRPPNPSSTSPPRAAACPAAPTVCSAGRPRPWTARRGSPDDFRESGPNGARSTSVRAPDVRGLSRRGDRGHAQGRSHAPSPSRDPAPA